MIEADAIVLKDLHLELVVVIIVGVLIPDVLGADQDLILIRKVLRDQAIEDDDQVDTELFSIVKLIIFDIPESLDDLDYPELDTHI
jgi:hypothetical protein